MDLSDPIGAVIPSVDGRVLLVLARSGLPVTGLQAARLAGASPERVRQVLRRLRDVGLVLAHRAGSAVLYEANRRHVLWPGVAALAALCDSALFVIKTRTWEELLHLPDPVDGLEEFTIALFGSAARGDSTRDSDVDMLVIVPDETPPDDVERATATIIDTVSSATGNECNVLAFTRSRFDDLIAAGDPLISSLAADADVFRGPDFRLRLTGAPWAARER